MALHIGPFAMKLPLTVFICLQSIVEIDISEPGQSRAHRRRGEAMHRPWHASSAFMCTLDDKRRTFHKP